MDDIESEHQKMAGLDYAPTDIREFHRDGDLMAKSFFVQDPDGYKIEVLKRHGRYVRARPLEPELYAPANVKHNTKEDDPFMIWL